MKSGEASLLASDQVYKEVIRKAVVFGVTQ